MTGAEQRKHPRGITLMELLVVMGLFSLTVGITSSIFLLSNQAQRRVLAITAAQADMRFALEAMAREVRGGQIDYETYEAAGGIQAPAEKLIIKSANGSRMEFYAETSAAVCPVGIAKCLAVRVDGTSQAVTSTGVLLQDLLFYITPSADPFDIDEASGLYKADSQPTVTIAIRIQTQGRKPEDLVTMGAQTTIAARTYAR